MKAYVEHLQSQINAGQPLPEQSREWLRLAIHLARLTDPTMARLEALHGGVDGNSYEMPFGSSLVK